MNSRARAAPWRSKKRSCWRRRHSAARSSPKRILGAGVIAMDDLRLGEEADPQACVADPLAPLHVLAVHEQALVEAARLLEDLARQQHEAPMTQSTSRSSSCSQ